MNSETPRTDALRKLLATGTCLPDCDSHGHEFMCPRANGENVACFWHEQLERELKGCREKNLWLVNERLKDAKQVVPIEHWKANVAERDQLRAELDTCQRNSIGSCSVCGGKSWSKPDENKVEHCLVCQLRAELNEAKARLSKYERGTSFYQSTIDQLRAEVEKMKEAACSLASDANEAGAEVLRLRAEVERLRVELKLAKVENNHNWQALEISEETAKERDAWREMAEKFAYHYKFCTDGSDTFAAFEKLKGNQ